MHKGAKFAPANEHGIFAGNFLQPRGRLKSEYLVISFEQRIRITGRIEVQRICKCALVLGPLTFALRSIRDIQINEDLRKASERLGQIDLSVEGELHQWLQLDDQGALEDDSDDDGAKTQTEEEPALAESSAIEDREPVVRILVRVPPASHV